MRVSAVASVMVGLICTGGPVWAQSPEGGSPSAPPTPWTWRPSLFLLAAADENTDPPVGAVPVDFEQPGFAGNLGAGLDAAHRTSRTRLAAGVFGLMRSPLSGPDRAMYVGGRISWSWQPAEAWRLDFRDSAKLQRQPQLDVAGFQRNNAAVGLEWRRPTSPIGLTLEVGDRRRGLPSLEVLGFARQSFTLGVVSSSATSAAEVGVGLQRYRAPTATGRRLVVSAEVAKFGHATIGSARYAFVDPRLDRSIPFTDEAGEQPGEFSDIDRADFLEQLAFAGSDSTIASEVFVLDPIETDSDDWEFGRRKHVLVGYLSRQLSGEAVLSGSVRYQRREGPNLLAPQGSLLAASFRDNRVALRLTYRRPLSRQFVLVAQASYLRNSGDRAIINFSRRLLGIGLQIQF
ncbi:MAG TPA: hypothetical protein PLH72_12085 [Vicinamibacterales bacterium]|nr:hypothetical protein [Vicinamibacterales bacterium]